MTLRMFINNLLGRVLISACFIDNENLSLNHSLILASHHSCWWREGMNLRSCSDNCRVSFQRAAVSQDTHLCFPLSPDSLTLRRCSGVEGQSPSRPTPADCSGCGRLSSPGGFQAVGDSGRWRLWRMCFLSRWRCHSLRFSLCQAD